MARTLQEVCAQWWSWLTSSREEIDAVNEVNLAQQHGTQLIETLELRQRVCVSGVLQAITYTPALGRPRLVGRLYDGTGTIDLVWMGRHRIAGIEPGVRLRATGMVVAGRSRPVMYNPTYELLSVKL